MMCRYTGMVSPAASIHANRATENTGASEADYMARVGGLAAVSALPLPVF